MKTTAASVAVDNRNLPAMCRDGVREAAARGTKAVSDRPH